MLALAMLPGCGQRYSNASDSACNIAVALVSAASSRKLSTVERVETVIDRERASGQITATEAEFLHRIAAHCRDGAWDEANREARAVIAAQWRAK